MMVEESLTDRLVAFLETEGADFRVMTHEPVTTSEEAARVRGTLPEQGAKALLCKADGRPVLLVLPGNRRMNSRAFKRAFGVANLRMVSPEELYDLTGLPVGAVPPFGNLLGFATYVDADLLALSRIAFNAGSRTTSVIMATADYTRLAQPTVASFATE